MSLGMPVAVSGDPQKRRFQPLGTISVRRDDPKSFKESLLQELISEAPSVLPVREYLPSTTTLFSLGREVPVSLGANQGYIDNLLVTNDGYLVIVETKLYRNPEGIREVIAQTLQYGMAVSQLQLMELESRIRQGIAPSLKVTESIRDCVFRQVEELGRIGVLSDDFEEALERHLRRGEVLLLIVSDGIHIGVERVTSWLNENGNSSPYRFGLVELRFHTNGDEQIVVPRTVLKTREVSRHVVVVDIKQESGVTASAEVTDELLDRHGAKVRETRPVKLAQDAMTKLELLKQVSAEDQPIVSAIFDQLEQIGLSHAGTSQTLRFGVTYPIESENFIPIAYFWKNDVYLQTPAKVLALLDEDSKRSIRAKGAELGFFKKEQIDQPNAASSNVKYAQLGSVLPLFISLLDEIRSKLIAAIEVAETE